MFLCNIDMRKSAYRTTTPFDGGLSPLTNKSGVVPLFGDTPLIQDILRGNPDGGRNYQLSGGGDWSHGDEQKNYREKGDDYKIKQKIQEALNRHRGRNKPEEKWIATDFEGKRHVFPSYEAIQRRLRTDGAVFREIVRVAQANTPLTSQTLAASVMVESISPDQKTKEVGAAFCIGKGLFFTCAHVIKRYNKLSMPATINEHETQIILRQNDRAVHGQLVAADLKLDAAIVQSDFESPILKLGSTQKAAIGEKVFSVGSPNGFENNFSEGVLSSKDRRVFFHPGAPTYIFTDAQVLPGSSGGALMSYDQQAVIGMISMIVGGQGLYGLNAALPVEYIIDFLRRSRV